MTTEEEISQAMRAAAANMVERMERADPAIQVVWVLLPDDPPQSAPPTRDPIL